MNQLLLNKSTLECNQLVKLFVLLPFVGSSQLCIATNRQPRVTECYKSWIVKGFRLLTFKQFKFCDWFYAFYLYYKGHIHLLTSFNHLNQLFMYISIHAGIQTLVGIPEWLQYGLCSNKSCTLLFHFTRKFKLHPGHKIHISWGPPVHPYKYGCMDGCICDLIWCSIYWCTNQCSNKRYR